MLVLRLIQKQTRSFFAQPLTILYLLKDSKNLSVVYVDQLIKHATFKLDTNNFLLHI